MLTIKQGKEVKGTGNVEPAVRAGPSEEPTPEQRPQCTRLITPRSSSSPGLSHHCHLDASPACPLLQVWQPSSWWQGWAREGPARTQPHSNGNRWLRSPSFALGPTGQARCEEGRLDSGAVPSPERSPGEPQEPGRALAVSHTVWV